MFVGDFPHKHFLFFRFEQKKLLQDGMTIGKKNPLFFVCLFLFFGGKFVFM